MSVLTFIILVILEDLPSYWVFIIQLVPILIYFGFPVNENNIYGPRTGVYGIRDAIFTFFEKFTDFSGRASRLEYFTCLIFITLLDFFINFLIIDFKIYVVYFIFIMVPTIALSVRRMHDINRSGWWLILQFIPPVGTILIFILTCLDGTKSEDKKKIFEKTKSVNLPIQPNQVEKNNTNLIDKKYFSDFETAIVFFPHLKQEYNSLKIYGLSYQEKFISEILKSKKFDESIHVFEDIEKEALNKLFGENGEIQLFGKSLLEKDDYKNISKLQEIVRIMGSSVGAKQIMNFFGKDDFYLNLTEDKSHKLLSAIGAYNLNPLISYKMSLEYKDTQIISKKINFNNLNADDINKISIYNTLIRHPDGQTKPKKLYLAYLVDGQIVGFDPEKFKYQIFTSPISFSEITKIFHGHFKVSSIKDDVVEFLNQISE